MAEVATRLPVQHRRRPHCPKCKRDLPALQTMTMSLTEDEAALVKSIDKLSLTVTCHCGAQWALHKDIDNG